MRKREGDYMDRNEWEWEVREEKEEEERRRWYG